MNFREAVRLAIWTLLIGVAAGALFTLVFPNCAFADELSPREQRYYDASVKADADWQACEASLAAEREKLDARTGTISLAAIVPGRADERTGTSILSLLGAGLVGGGLGTAATGAVLEHPTPTIFGSVVAGVGLILLLGDLW